MTDQPPEDQLIGRAHELERVADALAAGRPVLIIGEPGVGKTSLARAGARAADPPRIWEGGGIATLDWVSYLPFRRALGLALPDGDAAVVAEFLIEHAGDGTFIVDDLQWVDHDTTTATVLLAAEVPVIAVTRPMPHGHNVRQRLVRAGFDVVSLMPLAESDGARLAVAQNPALTPPAARSVALRAGGNPLLVQGLAYAGEDTTELAYALRARLAELSRAAREALHRVAVLERPTRLEVAPDDLRQLREMGLVTETREGVQVRHALIADAVLEGLSPAHLRELHRAVAVRVDDPGEAARHWAAAGERERARKLAIEASQSADRPVERARCAALAAQCLRGPQRDEELVAAMGRLAAHGEFAAVADLGTELAAGGRQEPEACRLRARGLFEVHDIEGAAQAIETGLEAARRLGDAAAEIRLEITAAYHDVWVTDVLARRPIELIERAEAEGVADAEMYVQAAAALVASVMDPKAAELARRGRELGRDEGHAWAEQESWVVEATCLDNLGREAEGREVSRIGEADLLAKGYHATVARLRAARAEQEVWQCAYDTALRLTAELVASRVLPAGSWDQTWRSRALALDDVGQADEADALLAEVAGSAHGDRAYWHAWIRSEVLLTRGDAPAAIQLSRTAVDLAVTEFMQPQAGATLARAQWECDVPITREGWTTHTGAFGLYNVEIDALAALQKGAAEEAIALFTSITAATGWRRHALRYRLGLAEALDLVDPCRAVQELTALVDELRDVGWVTLLKRVEPLLSDSPGGRRLRATPTGRPDVVTQREHDVLTLVADGLTSRVIAERLAITQPTVESHIRSAMRKLNARTRTEAAAMIRAPREPI